MTNVVLYLSSSLAVSCAMLYLVVHCFNMGMQDVEIEEED